MDMMLVLGFLALIYFVSLTLICLYRDSINVKLFNTCFIILDVIFYFIWNVGMYESGWLEDGFATLENISPMIFTVIPLTVFMNEKTKQCAYSAIAFLWVGMFVAFFVSPEQAYIVGDHKDATLVYTGEALCHMLASLFGIYLILTKQVKPNFQSWRRSLLFMYSVILFGVFVNYVFHVDHFGMDPYGKYSIYFIDIFGTFEATFAAYLFGVLLVLTLGMELGYLMQRFVTAKKGEEYELQPLDGADKTMDPLGVDPTAEAALETSASIEAPLDFTENREDANDEK